MNMLIKTAIVLAALAAGPALANNDAPAKGRTLLLADDHDVLYRSGTQRVAGIPTRHSENALIPSDREWEMLIGYPSVYRNPESGK